MLDRPPAFALQGASRRFPVGLGLRKRTALFPLDLRLAQGESLALVGPNGSGKSTLLRLLAGVDRASAGRVSVLGGDAGSSAVRQRVGWCPENAPFPADLSGLAALRLLASLGGQSAAEAAPALERVGLGDAAGRALRAYSRGMLRRFALAQAFLGSPDLVLLDEPTAGLDGPGFAVLDDLLEQHRARGGSLVLASHLVADVHAHCATLAVLVAGKLVGSGPPAELLAAPGERIELTGLDSSGLDRLRAWVGEQGGEVVASGPRQLPLATLFERASGENAGPQRP